MEKICITFDDHATISAIQLLKYFNEYSKLNISSQKLKSLILDYATTHSLKIENIKIKNITYYTCITYSNISDTNNADECVNAGELSIPIIVPDVGDFEDEYQNILLTSDDDNTNFFDNSIDVAHHNFVDITQKKIVDVAINNTNIANAATEDIHDNIEVDIGALLLDKFTRLKKFVFEDHAPGRVLDV